MGLINGFKPAVEATIDIMFKEKTVLFRMDNVYQTFLSEMEEPLITEVYKRAEWNQVRAARILGINRNTLRKKIKKYNIVGGINVRPPS